MLKLHQEQLLQKQNQKQQNKIMETTEKSPNRLWRESGTTLSFANWIQREKDKSNFLINKKFENFSNMQGTEEKDWLDTIKKESRDFFELDKSKDNNNDNTFIGLSKPILIVSALIIVGAIGYKIYQKRK
jgi:hypothetical protein